jgi:4-carboxymuconolactone decarboxylase
MAGMARVDQITEKAQLAPEYHYLYDRIAQARGRVGGPYSILLHTPGIADKVDALSASLRGDSQLTAAEFVLAALAVARVKDCLFVWSVQVPNARKAGVSDAAIAAIRDRQATGLTDDQADLVSFAQQVIGANRVDQALFERLKGRHGVRWLVDLTVTAGHFGLISGVNNAFEVPPSPGEDSLPV